MKERAITPVPTALTALGLALVTACGHGHHGSGGFESVVFHEEEPNDFVDEANDFGVLHAGDFLVIEGEIFDDGVFLDPFDGFAFRAASPLTVVFDLFVDDPFSEVRVGLYDPSIDETVAFWYQDHGRVHGELDVFFGGADFQLFIELLQGDTTYGLEVEAFLPFGAEAGARRAAELSATGAKGARARLAPREASSPSEDERRSAARYEGRPAVARGTETEADPVVGEARLYVLDEASSEISRDSFLITAGGSWMGIPGEALVE